MREIFSLALIFLAAISAAFAADRTIDLSNGCKVYELIERKWAEVDAASMQGLGLSHNQILKDENFTVFRTKQGTFGINRRCVVSGEPSAEGTKANPPPIVRRRAAAPAPIRGDLHSPWSAVFSFGYNLAPSGTIKTTYLGASESDPAKFTGSLSFLGEGNYRVNGAFRIALELGISQLQVNSQEGNETSFFDTRPEYIFRAGPKWEIYIGPMIGLFFLSQNTEPRGFPVGSPNNGVTIKVKQQTASALLVGAGIGADYALNEQFDLGFYLRYFKPGTLKVTGTEDFPIPGNTYTSELTTSYLNAGLRFVIHF